MGYKKEEYYDVQVTEGIYNHLQEPLKKTLQEKNLLIFYQQI